MKCIYCGRELDQGQTYCLCGQNVSALTGGLSNPEAYPLPDTGKKKNSMLAVLLVIIAALIAVGCFSYLGIRKQHRITHEEQWETVTMGECSIKLPSGMKDGTLLESPAGMTLLGFVTDNELGVGISVMRFTDEQKKIIKRVDFLQLMKEVFPTQSVNGVTLEPQQRGDMLYVEIPDDSPTWQDYKVLDAMYLTDDGLYEVEIHCPEQKYDDYKLYMLKWLDTFHVNA